MPISLTFPFYFTEHVLSVQTSHSFYLSILLVIILKPGYLQDPEIFSATEALPRLTASRVETRLFLTPLMT